MLKTLFNPKKGSDIPLLLHAVEEYIAQFYKETPSNSEAINRTDSGKRFNEEQHNYHTGNHGSSDLRFSRIDNYSSENIKEVMSRFPGSGSSVICSNDIETYTDMSFVNKLLEIMCQKHLIQTDVYKAAHLDRRLFSKILCNKDYKPAKDTCISLALALNLTLSEAKDLISRAGYSLSHSIIRDVIFEYFFDAGIYDIDDINDVLFRMNQKILGQQT